MIILRHLKINKLNFISEKEQKTEELAKLVHQKYLKASNNTEIHDIESKLKAKVLEILKREDNRNKFNIDETIKTIEKEIHLGRNKFYSSGDYSFDHINTVHTKIDKTIYENKFELPTIFELISDEYLLKLQNLSSVDQEKAIKTRLMIIDYLNFTNSSVPLSHHQSKDG
jgi:hypothetical protein